MPLNKGKEHFFMGTIIWIAFSSVSSARSSTGSIHKLYLFHLLCTCLLFSTLRGFHNYYSNAHNNCFKRRVGHQLCSLLLPTRGCAPQRGAGASPSYCLHQKIGDASLCSQEQVHLLRNEPAELILIAISLWARIQPGIGHGITCDSLDLCGREDLFFILLLSLRLSSNGCFWRRFLPHAVFISFSFQQKDISSTAPCLHNTNK